VADVLLCEDDADICVLVEAILGAAGHGVVTTVDVAGALEAVATIRFDVVVTDLGLPDGDGADVCRTATGAGARVVVLTANAARLDDPLIAGASEILTKPFDASDLVSAVAGQASSS
jgi:DNA-binding response OmpR family regulator